MQTGALLHVPDTNHTIQRTGDNVFPVELKTSVDKEMRHDRRRTHDERIDTVGVSFESVNASFFVREPHTYGVIIGARDNVLAVVANTTHSGCMTTQHVKTFTRSNIPHTRGGRRSESMEEERSSPYRTVASRDPETTISPCKARQRTVEVCP